MTGLPAPNAPTARPAVPRAEQDSAGDSTAGPGPAPGAATSRPRRARGWVRSHADVLATSSSLYTTTLITSVIGFGYWWAAARGFPAAAVGSAAASTSALTLLGSLGMVGLGTLLVTELGRDPTQAPRLVPTSVAAAAGLSALLATGYVLLAPLLSPGLREAVGPPWQAALLVAGTSVGAAAFVVDQAVVGLLAGRIQLSRNAVFAVAKLLLLVAVPALGIARSSGSILATWVGGLVVSLGVVAVLARRAGIALTGRVQPRALRGLGRATTDHSLLNLAITVPRLALPLVVTAAVSPSANAAFYAAWMVATFLYVIPFHLTTSLLAVVSADASVVRRKLRLTLGVAFAVGVPAALVVAAGAGPIMHIFGPQYATVAGVCLAMLALAYPANVIKQHYVVVSRIADRMRIASLWAGAFGVLELIGTYLGGRLSGVTGVGVAFLAVCTVEGLVLLPPVLRPLRAGRPGAA